MRGTQNDDTVMTSFRLPKWMMEWLDEVHWQRRMDRTAIIKHALLSELEKSGVARPPDPGTSKRTRRTA